MIAETGLTVNRAPFPLITPEQKRYEIVKTLVTKILAEMTWTMGTATITVLFVATPAGITLLILSNTIALIFNIIIRSIHAYTEYKAYLNHSKRYELLNFSGTCLAAISTSTVATGTWSTLVHEIGHVAVIKLVYKNPSCTITIDPFLGGLTTRAHSILSELGKKIGALPVKVLVSAAGPFASILLCSIMAAWGTYRFLRSQDQTREIASIAMIGTSAGETTHTVAYALSALGNVNNSGHDFNSIYKLAGIHPITCAVTAVAIPAIAALSAYLLHRQRG